MFYKNVMTPVKRFEKHITSSGREQRLMACCLMKKTKTLTI